jgi:transcriptional antiterminator NusG
MELTMEKKWYVVHTYSGYEQKVKELLEENIKINKMDDYFGDIVVPSEVIMERVKGRSRNRRELSSRATLSLIWP